MKQVLWKEKARNLWHRYGHCAFILYILIYLPWFSYLEEHVTHFHVVHMVIDDYIPFVEYFVIPYFFWFFYVFGAGAFFFLHNIPEFKRYATFLITGMTIFLIISTIYPNGAYLRPSTFPRDNFCTDLVKWLYSNDTPTNLFPSIHVFNSIGVHMAICYSEEFRNRKGVQTISGVIMILIIMSTMFLKQHSFFDVLTAFIMAAFLWAIMYAPSLKKSESFQTNFSS